MYKDLHIFQEAYTKQLSKKRSLKEKRTDGRDNFEVVQDHGNQECSTIKGFDKIEDAKEFKKKLLQDPKLKKIHKDLQIIDNNTDSFIKEEVGSLDRPHDDSDNPAPAECFICGEMKNDGDIVRINHSVEWVDFDCQKKLEDKYGKEPYYLDDEDLEALKENKSIKENEDADDNDFNERRENLIEFVRNFTNNIDSVLSDKLYEDFQDDIHNLPEEGNLEDIVYGEMTDLITKISEVAKKEAGEIIEDLKTRETGLE